MLIIAMYHYILPDSPIFKGLKGMNSADYRAQIKSFCDYYEMATTEAALAYIVGDYTPRKPMMLTSYDDALSEHAGIVAETLVDHGVDGVFGIPTRPLEEGWLTATHKNHLLLGELTVEDYTARIHALADISLGDVPRAQIRNTYRWDTEEVARLKYIINFVLDHVTRDRVLDEVFASVFGSEQAVARDFHMNWEDARHMQSSGLTIAGHGHNHVPISSCDDPHEEIALCTKIITEQVGKAPDIFTFPFGKMASFGEKGIQAVRDANYSAAFSTIVGSNPQGSDAFCLRRFDPKDFSQDGALNSSQ